ncbi:MAG: VF530 family protein [Spirochaetota bacterium]
MTEPIRQVNNPLHGMTLEAMLITLVKLYGWKELFRLVSIRCFLNEPSIKSSLKFLRQTPWARQKVEEIYLHTVADPEGRIM